MSVISREPATDSAIGVAVGGEAVATMASPPLFDSFIAVCAFRYALGRMTHAVEHVADWLIQHRAEICSSDRVVIVCEIEEALTRDRAGMELDRQCWRRVRAVLAAAERAPATPDA